MGSTDEELATKLAERRAKRSSDDELQAKIDARRSKTKTPDEGPSTLDAAGHGLAQGFTFKFGDEIQGLTQAIGNKFLRDKAEGYQPSFAEDWARERDQARAEDVRMEAAHPKAFVGSEIVGALPGAIAAPVAAAGKGILAMIGAGAGFGAVTGAITGVGGSRNDPFLNPDDAALDVIDSASGGAIAGAGGALIGRGLGHLFTRFTSAGKMNAALRTLQQHEGIANQTVARTQGIVGQDSQVPLQAVENAGNRTTLQKMFRKPDISRISGEGDAAMQGAVNQADATNAAATGRLNDADIAVEAERAAGRDTLRQSRNDYRNTQNTTAVSNEQSSALAAQEQAAAKTKYQTENHARGERQVSRKNQHLQNQEDQYQAIEEARNARNQEIRELRKANPALNEALAKTKSKELPNVLDKHLGADHPARADLDQSWENLKAAREPIPRPRLEAPVAPPPVVARPQKAVAPAYQEPATPGYDAARQGRVLAKQGVESAANATQHIYDTADQLSKSMAKIQGAKASLSDLISPSKNLRLFSGKQWLDNRNVKKILSDPETYKQFMDLAATGKRLTPGTAEAEAFGAQMAAFVQSLRDDSVDKSP